MCSAKMKEGKILASNRLVESCTLYLVCIAWRLEQQKVQNWIWFSGKWETWTLWEEQSSVRSLGKALAWWLPKVCASICCQVLRPVFSIWCTCWFWVLNLHNISNIFPLSPSVEFLILQFSKLFFTSELILSTFTVGKQSLSSTLQRSQTILSSITLSELTPGSLVVAEQPLLVLDPPTDRWMILLFLMSTMIK